MARLWRTAEILATLQSTTHSEFEIARGYRQCLEMMFSSRLQIVDQNLLQRRQLKVSMAGRQHIDRAIDAGRGAILWICPTACSDLIAKMGIAQAGFSVAHLSRPQHGFSNSKFGMAMLNRVRTRVEDRFLRERVPIDDQTGKQAVLALRRIIKSNSIVTITVGAQTKAPQHVALAGGTIPISAGPARLAGITGAPLLPVFAVRTGDSKYEVRVEAPINAGERDMVSTLQCYADFLSSYVNRYPYQCREIIQFSAAKQP